jgi:hypothetical protein
MTTEMQIQDHINGLPEPKRGDMLALHQLILQAMPDCRLWFLDGEDTAVTTSVDHMTGVAPAISV